MTAFTILGVLFFWMFCWEAGYLIAQCCDAKVRLDTLLKPITNEVEAMIQALDAAGIGKDLK